MAKPPLNGVAETEYTKSHIRGLFPLSRRRQHTRFAYVLIPPLKKYPLSPRGDQCEQSAPTVPQQHSHGYRFETPPRRLGFTAVPCQATANLAV